MELELDRIGDGERVENSPVTVRTLTKALVVHLVVFGFFALLAWMLKGCEPDELPPPTELTIVPPWAVQTDDPEPDPLPPPDETPQPQPKVKPPPAPKAPDVVPDAVIKEKPKEKPKEPPKPKEKPDFKKNAKFVKESVQPPKPVDLRDKAKFKDIPPEIPRTGKATAADKPMTPEEFNRLMNQGYQIGARNQLATSEEQRCVSLIKRAIQAEWDKEDFNWFPGLSPLKVELKLGLGGQVLGFRILRGSGSAEVDQTARAALNRLRSIPGLSQSFLRKFPVIDVEMTPVQGG